MKLLSLLLFTALLAGCGNSKNTADSTSEETEEKGPKAKMAILSQDIAKFRDSESYSILDMDLVGNILQLNISYNGGCKDHEFELVGSSFITSATPPKRLIQLYHHKNDDDCRELVHEALFFDISDFAHKDAEITLQLQHFKESFPYTKATEE